MNQVVDEIDSSAQQHVQKANEDIAELQQQLHDAHLHTREVWRLFLCAHIRFFRFIMLRVWRFDLTKILGLLGLYVCLIWFHSTSQQ